MKVKNNFPHLTFEDQQSWETWLSQHYADSNGIWLMIAKKASSLRSVSYAEAVESAIAYGWIDSQAAAFDEKYYIQKFTPRRPKSAWSKTNRDKAIELIKAQRMQPSGMHQVELAKANGQWDKDITKPDGRPE